VREGEIDKAREVRDMFGSIAHRYDFLNHFLSLSIDRYWRRACVVGTIRRMTRSQPTVLDIGCGTADLSLEFARSGPVVGCDFSHPMLRIGKDKIASADTSHPVALLEADALNLPFRDGSFDAVASAFVLRNLASPQKGLEEMKRVLRPGGVVSILDFGLPKATLLRGPYLLYFNCVLPRLGKIFSGVDGPYKYLPDSVQLFPSPEELGANLRQAGFGEIDIRRLSGGIAIVIHARG